MKKNLCYTIFAVVITAFSLLVLQTSCNKVSNTNAKEQAPLSSGETVAKTWDDYPIETLNGNLDYVFKGCSFSSTETSCDNLKKGTISITIPAGAVIKRAYLLWSSSGKNDTQVTLDASQSCNTKKTQTISGSDGLNGYVWYKNYSDVTTYVATKKSGSYVVTNLDFDNGGIYCSSYSTVGIASLFVVYEMPQLPNCDIHVFMPDINSMAYPDKLVQSNCHLPDAGSNGATCGCTEKDFTICTNWCEGDHYKPEYCKIMDSVLAENTLDGSEAPNLDIDTYSFKQLPSNRVVPIQFKGYFIAGYYYRLEAAYMQCVVIKVLKGNDGQVCSCLNGPDGKPLANYSFQLKDSTGKLIDVKTDAMGKWCQTLPKGKYQLLISGNYQIASPVNFTVSPCTCMTLPCTTVTPKGGCVDADKDGVCDGDDHCPNDPGPPENGGCPQIVFNSAGDINYSSSFVSMKQSANNSTLTNVIATPTQADQTSLGSYYILSVGSFTPTVGQTFSVKSVALQSIPNYGSLLSKTYNINVNIKVEYYNPASHYIKLSYSGNFENQGTSNTKTYNINGAVTCTYNP